MKKGYKNLKEFLDAPGTIGLVVEGGGMRSIFANSTLLALSQNGYAERFNVATGSSAGATHIYYMLGGNSQYAIDLNTSLLPNAGFVDFKRFSKIMDVGILEDFMYKEDSKHGTVKKMRSSKTKLVVPLTDIEKTKQVSFDLRKVEDPIHMLCAGMSVPVLDNEVRYIDGVGYIDSGLLDILPIHLIETECDRILVIRTSKKNKYKPYRLLHGLISKIIYHSTLKAGYKIALKSLKNKEKSFKRMKEEDIFVIHPPKGIDITRTSHSEEQLLVASKATLKMMDNLLS